MTFRCLARSLPIALAALLVASSASADDAADTATARSLGVEGVTLAHTEGPDNGEDHTHEEI